MMTHLLAAALAIHISNYSGASPAVVQNAQDEVSRVYADIGVTLDWHGSPSDDNTDPPSTIRLVLLPYETGDLRLSKQQVMGAAVWTVSHTAVAYIFYRRVQAEAKRYDVSTDRVLACAIAHELGHLLLPMRDHAPTGLMRECWSRAEFYRAQQGELRFLPADIDRIRARLR